MAQLAATRGKFGEVRSVRNMSGEMMPTRDKSGEKVASQDRSRAEVPVRDRPGKEMPVRDRSSSEVPARYKSGEVKSARYKSSKEMPTKDKPAGWELTFWHCDQVSPREGFKTGVVALGICFCSKEHVVLYRVKVFQSRQVPAELTYDCQETQRIIPVRIHRGSEDLRDRPVYFLFPKSMKRPRDVRRSDPSQQWKERCMLAPRPNQTQMRPEDWREVSKQSLQFKGTSASRKEGRIRKKGVDVICTFNHLL